MIQDLFISAVEDIQDESGFPKSSFGTWPEEANRIDELRSVMESEKDFPLAFLVEPITENFDKSERKFSATLNIFIIGETKTDYTAKQRHENEMPTLRTIETDLLKKLKQNGIEFEDYEREEIKFGELNVNLPVNAIRLELPALYDKYCLT